MGFWWIDIFISIRLCLGMGARQPEKKNNPFD
jgi:hypothetical protein